MTDLHWRFIRLTQNQLAIVDAEDYEKVMSINNKWFAHHSRWTYYAVTKKNGRPIKMHHAIIGNPPPGKVTDHENRNGCDNRKRNINHVTDQQNRHNRGKYSNNISGFPGVYYCETQRGRKFWHASLRRDGKQRLIGRYLTKEEAIQARQEALDAYTNR
jgi:hypothetical protein